MLFREFRILNVLNLEKWGIKIHNCAFYLTFLLFFYYTARMPLFSRLSPAYKLVCQELLQQSNNKIKVVSNNIKVSNFLLLNR